MRNTNHNRAQSQALTPYQAPTATSLDPYPERNSAVTGVRKTADIRHLNPVDPEFDGWAVGPSVVAASVKPEQRGPRSWPVPLASLIIACLSQLVLAMLMASKYVPAFLGLIIGMSIMLCSLLLVTAQTIHQAAGRDEVY